MFGRIKNVGNTHNSFETVDKFSNSRDSENISLIHTPPTVLIRYVAPLLFMRFIQYMIINSTKLLILDYKQFKAARLLQKIIRGWLVRHEMKKRNNAALVIQRAWWRYIAKRFRSSMAQQILQTYIVDSFNHKSIKIQALFRGWHSRRRIYNMRHLAIIQKQALEELLTNMVHKMHKINQRNELPGVFSFCDNSENIEKFLTTLTYRIYNCYVGKNINLLKTLRDERRVDFLNSVHYTKLPFIGAVENCAQLVKPEMFVREGKPYSIKDFDIAEAFLAGNHPKTKIKNKRIMLNKKMRVERKMNEKILFCRDVFKGMSRWSIFRNANLQCNASLTDDSIVDFFADFKEYLLENNLMEDCYCQRDTKPKNYFPDVQF